MPLFKQKRQVDIRMRSPGGYSLEFLVGVCRPVLQILTLFLTKKCHSRSVFRPDRKIHTRFQTWGPFLESPGDFSGPKSNILNEI